MNGEDVPRYFNRENNVRGMRKCDDGSMSSHNHYYYRCNRQTLQASASCTAPLAGVVKVENTVIKAIKDHLADTESLRGAFDEFKRSQTTDGPDPAEELGNLKAAMKRKDQERERLVDAVASGG